MRADKNGLSYLENTHTDRIDLYGSVRSVERVRTNNQNSEFRISYPVFRRLSRHNSDIDLETIYIVLRQNI